MKKLFSLALVLAMAFAVFGGISTASASARTASWVVSITYQNVGSAATTVEVDFYEEGSTTAIPFEPLGTGNTLAAGAGASFFIGKVSGVAEGFRGNAVMKSQQPLVATVVQFSQDAGFKMRLLSNAFQSSDGSTQYLISTTLLNKFDRVTVFSIQNTQATDVTATVKFYDADDNGKLASSIDHTVKANSSKYIEMDNTADTGLAASTTVFNGSAIITVPSGAVVAAASELYTNRDVAANFEGLPVAGAANTMYLATALCQKFSLDTFYAVQNASLTDNANITVTYKNLDGSTKATDGPFLIGPGQKKSINTCKPNDSTVMTGFSGAATITTGAGEAPITVIGKAQCSVAPGTCASDKVDVFTAFLGEAQGYSKIAMPFIRWGSDARFNAPTNNGGVQRAFIAIQNLGSSDIKVDVKYYDKNGGLAATEVLDIAANSKGNSNAFKAGALGFGSMNPGEFGYYTDGSFGGSVIAEANSANPTAKFIAVVRVQHPGAGEDYNAVLAP